MPLCSRECPPGLSISQTNRVAGKQSLDRDILLMRKVKFWMYLRLTFCGDIYYIYYLDKPIANVDKCIRFYWKGENMGVHYSATNLVE